MRDHIVGMFWNKNEADLLPFTLQSAIQNVDSLFIADDGSTDSSWEIIKNFQSKHKDKIEHIQQNPNRQDAGQRQSLLNKIKKRYKPETTWVQIIESDIMIVDTDIREALIKHAVGDVAMTWQTLNAVRLPGTWKEVDTYPNWNESIDKIMPYAHFMEYMVYTFRPLSYINYIRKEWRPWPSGWRRDILSKRRLPDSPLLGHYGFRGPTHFYHKYKHMGVHHKKYKNWRLGDVRKIESTVPFFNGQWNNPESIMKLNRQGWIEWMISTSRT